MSNDGSAKVNLSNISALDLELMYQLHQSRRDSLPSVDYQIQQQVNIT